MSNIKREANNGKVVDALFIVADGLVRESPIGAQKESASVGQEDRHCDCADCLETKNNLGKQTKVLFLINDRLQVRGMGEEIVCLNVQIPHHSTAACFVQCRIERCRNFR